MSTLKVDSILDTSGNDTVAGKILQVQYTINTTYSSQAFATNSTEAIDNMSVNITPSSTSSKIFLQANWFGEFSNQVGSYNGMWGFLRDSTRVFPFNSGESRTYGISASNISYWGNQNVNTPEGAFIHYVDAPASTSQITYKLCWTGSAYTMYHNRPVTDNNTAGYERGTSMIIAMEIAG